jgi:ribonuclease HII
MNINNNNNIYGNNNDINVYGDNNSNLCCDNNIDNLIVSEQIVSEKNKKKRNKIQAQVLNKFYKEDNNIIEIGVDEAGRGPLFGSVYTAAVILPKDDTFNHSIIKDSKKFHSKKKIEEVANYIKKNALAWYVSFEDEKTIDNINILQATQLSMHNSILKVKKQYDEIIKKENIIKENGYSYNLLIDGNYFNPVTYLNKKTNTFESIPYICIEGGDNKYTSIAAASILAKVERDKYIEDLCIKCPELITYYNIDSNKGYGAKKHIEGIKQNGITIWHRKSFGICKNY